MNGERWTVHVPNVISAMDKIIHGKDSGLGRNVGYFYLI